MELKLIFVSNKCGVEEKRQGSPNKSTQRNGEFNFVYDHIYTMLIESIVTFVGNTNNWNGITFFVFPSIDEFFRFIFSIITVPRKWHKNTNTVPVKAFEFECRINAKHQ